MGRSRAGSGVLVRPRSNASCCRDCADVGLSGVAAGRGRIGGGMPTRQRSSAGSCRCASGADGGWRDCADVGLSGVAARRGRAGGGVLAHPRSNASCCRRAPGADGGRRDRAGIGLSGVAAGCGRLGGDVLVWLRSIGAPSPRLGWRGTFLHFMKPSLLQSVPPSLEWPLESRIPSPVGLANLIEGHIEGCVMKQAKMDLTAEQRAAFAAKYAEKIGEHRAAMADLKEVMKSANALIGSTAERVTVGAWRAAMVDLGKIMQSANAFVASPTQIASDGLGWRLEEETNVGAVLALMGYLEQASEDPKIVASPIVFHQVVDVLKALGDLDVNTTGQVPRVFAAIGRRETNTRNGKSKKLSEGHRSAGELCKKWFDDPELYKNKSRFAADVVAKEWCATPATALLWFDEFFAEATLSDAWRERFSYTQKRR